MGILDNFKEIFSGGEDSKILRYLVILGLVGTLLLFYSNLYQPHSSPPQHEEVMVRKEGNIDSNIESDRLKNELEGVLSVINGVGKVKIQLIYSQKSSYEYEYNNSTVTKVTTETDQNGGKRKVEDISQEKDMVIIRKENGSESPVVKVEKPPQVSGVIIVAEGAERSDIKSKINYAVSNFFDLPLYKINVLPYEGG